MVRIHDMLYVSKRATQDGSYLRKHLSTVEITLGNLIDFDKCFYFFAFCLTLLTIIFSALKKSYPKFMKKHNNYTTLTNLSTIYLVMCKVYTDVGGIKYM